MRILALDLALRTSGWAVLDDVNTATSNAPPVLLGAGTFSTASAPRKNEHRTDFQFRRGQQLIENLHAIVHEFQPTRILYEIPDYIRSQSGPEREGVVKQQLGVAEGLLIGHRLQDETCCPQSEAVSILAAREAFCSNRTASKEAVLERAKALYSNYSAWTTDMSDAVAIGYAGFVTSRENLCPKRTQRSKKKRLPPKIRRH